MHIITPTADGSMTLYHPEIGEHYHSTYGALQESKHVFINAGLLYGLETLKKSNIRILEIGFGTGLNFLLTLDYALQHQMEIDYTGLEPFPIDEELIEKTAYHQFVKPETWSAFLSAYPTAKQTKTMVNKYCSLKIEPLKLADFNTAQTFDILYYDAFSEKHQPQMWTNEIITHACRFLTPKGIFITYAITGNLKRTLKANGFNIEKLPGPPGKREILRALKM